MLEIGPKARGEVGPGLAPYLSLVSEVFEGLGFDARITHIRDGKHSNGSLHYVGDAIDVVWLPYRTLLPEVAEEIEHSLYLKLNGFPQFAGLLPDFDVVYEGSHFHIEYQPKLDDSEYRKQIDRYLGGEQP